jgi:hypothetical protein
MHHHHHHHFENDFFLTRAKLLLAEAKTRCNEGDGRVLVGDNTDGGAVVLRPIGFQCARKWI